MIRSIFSLLCLLVCFASCTIESSMHFNKDFSGTSTSSFDLSEMKSFASAFSEEGEDSSMDSLQMMLSEETMPDSVRMQLDSMKMMMDAVGFKDFTITPVDNAIQMSYSFDDLSVFEQGNISERIEEEFGEDAWKDMSDEDFSTLLQTSSVSKKGKWLTFDLTTAMGDFTEKMKEDLNSYDDEDMTDEEKEAEDASEEFAAAMMEGMLGMFELNQTYTFDRKIKEIECPLPYTSDKHSITLDFTMGDLIGVMKDSGGEKVEMKVKLK